VENWVEQIDRKVAANELMATTALRIWSVVRVMFRDASRSKIRALRVRDDNPAHGVAGPDATASRSSTFLYPSEFLRLVSCEQVPMVFRRLYAVTVYLFPRAGEMRSIRWEDIDLKTGRVHIHMSVDRKGSEGRTKTDADRQWVAEKTLLPLLRVMKRDDPKEVRVFPWIPQRHNLARALRQHLEMAGVKRADLFADDESRRPLTFHDLRATGITWQAMRGDSPTAIMERVGHASLQTTQGYIRRGLLLVSSKEKVFPRLPDSLLGKSTD
jgi:integrase